MVSLPNKLAGLLLPLLFAAYVAGDSVLHFTTLWTWRVAFARTSAQVLDLLCLRLEPCSVLASLALWVVFVHWVAPSAVAPFARWVTRLETRRQGFSGLDVLQLFALISVRVSLTVVIVDMALACIFGFLPFSLGRIILGCSSYFVNVNEVESYTSTSYTLRIGYGFIFNLGVCLAGLHAFHHYLRVDRLVITLFFRRLPGVFFRGFVHLFTVANVGLNLLIMFILRPLFFGWLLDIFTSKMFGATMSERSKLLIASSFASTALDWFIGCTFLSLRPRLSSFIVDKVLRLGVTFSLVDHDVYEPFYKFYLKKLLRLFVDTVFIALVILVPTEICDRLAPDVFPLNITYFNRPAKGESVWQGLPNYAVLLSAVLFARFLIGNTVIYLEWLVQRAIGYWIVTAGEALGNNVAPKDLYGSSDEAKDKRTYVARTMLRVVLAWLTAVIFNSAMLFCSISVGRALLVDIPQLPVPGGLKSNDLFATAVGLCIISTIIATSRDMFACMACGGSWFVALKRLLLLFVLMVIVPLLIGLLFDLSLISPFVGPDDDFPVLNYFCTWSLGWQLKNFWMSLAHCMRAAPFLAYFIDERWEAKLNQARAHWCSGAISLRWFFQDIYIPIATKLLTALGLPYVFAKVCFPRLGYSVAVNSTVYHFAWLGNLGFMAICSLGKVLCVKLHDSIRDDRYIIGERLQDVVDSS